MERTVISRLPGLEIPAQIHQTFLTTASRESVLINCDGFDGPRLPSIAGRQVALSIRQAQSLVVIRVGRLHCDGGVDVLVLRNGAAGLGLAFDCSAPSQTIAACWSKKLAPKMYFAQLEDEEAYKLTRSIQLLR